MRTSQSSMLILRRTQTAASAIISTRRGTDQWHGDFGYYHRARAFNARNVLDNPEPNPKQPFSRQNGVGVDRVCPLKTGKLWVFSSLSTFTKMRA